MKINSLYNRNKRRKQVEAKKKRRRTVFFTIGVLVVIFILINIIFDENGLLKYMSLMKVKKDLTAQVDNLSQQNKELRKQIEAIKDLKDPSLIEELAREQGLMYEDELIFQYPDEK
jgi:cell division protein FtsB